MKHQSTARIIRCYHHRYFHWWIVKWLCIYIDRYKYRCRRLLFPFSGRFTAIKLGSILLSKCAKIILISPWMPHTVEQCVTMKSYEIDANKKIIYLLGAICVFFCISVVPAKMPLRKMNQMKWKENLRVMRAYENATNSKDKWISDKW